MLYRISPSLWQACGTDQIATYIFQKNLPGASRTPDLKITLFNTLQSCALDQLGYREYLLDVGEGCTCVVRHGISHSCGEKNYQVLLSAQSNLSCSPEKGQTNLASSLQYNRSIIKSSPYQDLTLCLQWVHSLLNLMRSKFSNQRRKQISPKRYYLNWSLQKRVFHEETASRQVC